MTIQTNPNAFAHTFCSLSSQRSNQSCKKSVQADTHDSASLKRITKFRHFSGLTMCASKSLPNSTAKRSIQLLSHIVKNDKKHNYEKLYFNSSFIYYG